MLREESGSLSKHSKSIRIYWKALEHSDSKTASAQHYCTSCTLIIALVSFLRYELSEGGAPFRPHTSLYSPFDRIDNPYTPLSYGLSEGDAVFDRITEYIIGSMDPPEERYHTIMTPS
jgi:hypothetical protein